MAKLWNSEMLGMLVGVLLLTLCAGKGYCRPNDATDEADYNNDDPSYDDGVDEDEDADAYTGPPPNFLSLPKNITAKIGENVELECSSFNAESFVHIWLNHSESLFVDSVKVTQDKRVSLTPEHSLVLKSLQLHDSGPYTCQIGSIPVLNLTYYVSITSPPKIVKVLPEGKERTLKEGDTLTLECITSGFPEPTVTWNREDHKHLPNGASMVEGNILTIEKIAPRYAGRYACKADNGMNNKPAIQLVDIHVNYPPKITVETALVISGEGEECDLSCTVHAYPSPNVRWHKDAREVISSDRIKIFEKKNQHILKIHNLKKEDFGKYLCIAENTKGSNEKELEISGAPRKPHFIGVKSEGDSGVIIEWSVESYAPIEQFVLYYKKKLTPNWEEEDLHVNNPEGIAYNVMHSLNRLSTGEYDVYLKALNSYGWTKSDTKQFLHGDNGAPAAETSVAGPDPGSKAASLRPISVVLVTFIILSAYIL